MTGKRAVYRFGRSAFRDIERGNEREWLLTNGIGGYANSTVSGNNSRVFSGYLVAALHPPVERTLILAKTHEEIRFGVQTFDEEIQWNHSETVELATQQYPGQSREGFRYLSSFSYDVVPEYCYQVKGVTICKRLALVYGENTAALEYEIFNDSVDTVMLCVTPLFNFRPSGEVMTKRELQFDVSLQQEYGMLQLTPKKAPGYVIRFRTTQGKLFDRSGYPVTMATPSYVVEENELYAVDVANGFTGVDCHFTPYEVQIVLRAGEKKKIGMLCELLCFAQEEKKTSGDVCERLSKNQVAAIFDSCAKRAENLLLQAGCRDAFSERLVLAADHFLVKRASTGKTTILAGYPWFSDWGRDTMIAFTGLTLATGRFDEAAQVLESFAQYVDRGMVPNVFPDGCSDEPAYNTIDASLWYFYAVFQYLKYTTGYACYSGDAVLEDKAAEDASVKHKPAVLPELSETERFVKEKLYPKLCEIMNAYREGTARYAIHMDEDGLIAGGSELDQLTWMDVRVGELVVTPRHGKAVEINALWYNALRIAQVLGERFGDQENARQCGILAVQVKKEFTQTFWNEDGNYLYDVVALNGEKDATVRPNQIYAVALPFMLLTEEKAKWVVDQVYRELYTPYGLRSLAQYEKDYKGEYSGRLLKRDMAYHMGTAWGYLAGAFITAWVRTGGSCELAKRMCLCFADHLADGCLNGIAEIFDGDYADVSRGCYTQAWSVGEVLRVWSELMLFVL